MARKVAIGICDFSEIIEKACFYVDKTNFIKTWWETDDKVTLITRPRRFGKTLAMSMVEQFFSVEYAGRGDLFSWLSIWQESKYQKLQGTYPVISLQFSHVKESNFVNARKKICQILANLYTKNEFLLKSGFIDRQDAAFFQRVSATMDDADASSAIYQLSSYLSRYYKKKVVILLDEYDTPMQEAYINGYWDELARFLRGVLSSAFKDNPFLERGIMTGVTRISKESIFSGLNNLEVVTVTSSKYGTAFGFTAQEVACALEEFGLKELEADVRTWYDGYQFGDCANIYNPWSIINFLAKRKLAAYWSHTSANKMIGDLIRKGDIGVKQSVEDLLNGKAIYAAIDGEIVFNQLDDDEDAVWSLLLASGYLKVAGQQYNEFGGLENMLTLVNREVQQVFADMAKSWLLKEKKSYNEFVLALLSGDVEKMNVYINRVAMGTFSNFDTGVHPSMATQPERFYHGFLLGLMVDLKGRYAIASNRESGFGRYDVMLEPLKDQDDGIILEFKVHDGKGKGLEATVYSALRQILSRGYAASLEEKGVGKDRIRIYGFAFEGKNVLIGGGKITDLEYHYLEGSF